MSQHSRTGAAQPSEWIRKAEAAQMLQTSTRQIERRVAQGMIQQRTLDRLPGEKAGAVEYSRADVEALIAGKPNNHARIVDETVNRAKSGDMKALQLLAQSTPPRGPRAAAVPAAAGQLAQLLAAIAEQQPPKPAEPKPWLTLAEAAEYSGLPASWLMQQARLGSMSDFCKAVNVAAPGSKYERWRFSRRSLSL